MLRLCPVRRRCGGLRRSPGRRRHR